VASASVIGDGSSNCTSVVIMAAPLERFIAPL
jgi:hypothetical protein